MTHSRPQGPKVSQFLSTIFGYDYVNDGFTDSVGRDVGFETGFTADLSLGYQFLLYWLYRDGEHSIILNPNLNGEVAVHGWMAFKLYFLHIWFYLDLDFFKASPLDYEALWSLDNM